jgi:hypothetical protein
MLTAVRKRVPFNHGAALHKLMDMISLNENDNCYVERTMLYVDGCGGDMRSGKYILSPVVFSNTN